MTAIPNWTDVSNSFVLGTTSPYATLAASANYAQGGPFASSEIKQESAITDGYQYGQVVATFARKNALASDLGTVTIEALSAGSVVLATVTTGAESFATLNVWYRRKLVLQLPDGAVTIRVRLIATRTLGSGNSGACFDDFDVRVFKDLDPVDVLDLTYDAHAVQPVVTSWQEFHLAFPDLAGPALVFSSAVASTGASLSSHVSYSETVAWSDGSYQAPRSCIAPWGDGVLTAACFEFVRAASGVAVDLQVTDGSTERGAYTSEDDFTVRVVMRVTEYGLAAACGVVGRRDGTGIGWGIQIDATGHAKAVLQGDGGTKTATSTTTIHDLAVHQLVLVYNATADTLRIYVDRRGYNETSTASALGEFAVETAALRIGRDAASSQTVPAQIVEVDLIPHAYTQAEVESMWTFGADPTGATTPVLSSAVWVPQEPIGDGFISGTGVMLSRCATDQMPIGYSTGLTSDDGTGLGLAVTRGSTNLIPSNDTSDVAKWAAEATVTVTRGVTDATSLPKGIRVAGSVGAGLVLTPIAIGASSGTVALVLFVRATNFILTGTVNVELLSSADVVKATGSFTAGAPWARVALTGLAWDGATATCKIRLRSSVSFEVSHVAWAERVDVTHGQRIPTVFQDAGVALSNVRATATKTYGIQFNHEGEVDVTGVGTVAAPLTGQVIATVQNGTNNKNLRRLITQGSQLPRFVHYDAGTPTAVNADGSAIVWSTLWQLRGRWCRAGIPCAIATAFAGIVVEASADSDVQNARTAAWTVDTTLNDETLIGGGAAEETIDALLRRVVVRTREQKLPAPTGLTMMTS